ncbi:MAG: hypothetical protein MUQ30_02160 [Anaerolineae bacterium]|nr:hypothetical protein [Anaerolineae bacterium]
MRWSAGIATPVQDERIVWLEQTEHEMFREGERVAVLGVVVDYVRERVSGSEVV